MSTFIPFVCTLLIVTSAILVIVGWILIVKGRREAHQKVMVSAAIFAILFLILYVSRTAIFGNTMFPGPDSMKLFYTIFLLFHICLATSGAVMGYITIRHAVKGNFFKHKKQGPWTATIWILSAITGVIVYYMLYVKYATGEAGEIGNVFEAIFGK